MNCDYTTTLLDPLADDELPTETAAGVLEHLDKCPDCQDLWEQRASLKARFQAFSSRITIPEREGIERLDRMLDSELDAERNRLSRAVPGARRKALLAAAAVMAGLAATLFANYNPALEVSRLAKDPGPGLPEALVSAPETSLTRRLESLSSSVGFTVDPPALKGFRLVAADLYRSPEKRLCMARLTYQGNSPGASKRLRLYQTCSGRVNAGSLRKMRIGDRAVCCGQVDGMSIVYLPGKNTDSILISAMPEKSLMMLALGS